ncbi:hypothetical protein DAEQUDRAFT_762005 [Daedalea quercina L-15889]|uniref:Uncharacterized protein n=1 Tax=Daedalea quercina L-15889 TaxID=1314783 RepID=A0A165TJS4_9APHY|nr:hypothetical protein DAEQUDRAFT_762005 [Daedalea quercina L-15889]
MQFKLLSAVVLGALVTLPAAVSGNARVACGDGGEVITNTTFTANNKEFRVVTKACPGFVERRSLEKRVTSNNLLKRQYSICSYEATVVCEDLGAEPLLSGCEDLYDALVDYGSEEFYAPSDTLTTFTTSEDCIFAFANPSAYYYDVCYATVGELGLAVADDCFEYGGGVGEIASPDWYVEVYN